MKLLRRLILRPLWRDPLRSALTAIAVALGVAVVVAIELAGDAATGSFRSSIESLAGSADFEISANGGIDERLMARLTALPIDARFSPVMEAWIDLPRAGLVPLYGLDLLGGGPVISKPLAARIGRGEVTALIGGHPHRLRFERTADTAAGAEFAALDIADAQQWLGRYGKLDRIDVALAAGQDSAQAEAAIRAALPAGYFIERPGARNQENQQMLRAFRWNLRVLSYISLVVGAFLIYNTISISVVRRRGEIGILRALGATRRAIFAIFLTEALCFGLVGGAAGVALGTLLARGIVNMISSTVTALFITSRPGAIQLTPLEAAIGIAAGAWPRFSPGLDRRSKPPARTPPKP